MIRFYIILVLACLTGCGAVSSFLVGAGGNVFSDEISRQVEKKGSLTELPCGRSE